MTVVDLAIDRLAQVRLGMHAGAVLRVNSGTVVADGPSACVGDFCVISDGGTRRNVTAEVVAIDHETITLVPLERGDPIRPGARVILDRSNQSAPVGDAFAGRAVDAFGRPIDGLGSLLSKDSSSLAGRVLPPMARQEMGPLLPSGFACIDTLTPIGRGQRIGIFAASGVGKTTLIRRLSETIDCDHCVVCLVGERGKEVEQTWRHLSARPDRERFTVVAATSDQTASKRVQAVWQALALAEHWRDRGRHVLLLVDSVTRLALALREIGLSAGEPPTARAFTPNVFAALPLLVERCGAAKAGGAITGVFSVLCETDDADDPIAETMKSLLDGHIILSRRLAAQGQWPALDPLRSISRQSDFILDRDISAKARRIIELLARYDEGQVMIESGVYRSGTDPVLDLAINARPQIMAFLARGAEAAVHPEAILQSLKALPIGAQTKMEHSL